MDNLGLTTFYVYFWSSWEGTTSEKVLRKRLNLAKVQSLLKQERSSNTSSKAETQASEINTPYNCICKNENCIQNRLSKRFPRSPHKNKATQCCLSPQAHKGCSGKLWGTDTRVTHNASSTGKKTTAKRLLEGDYLCNRIS